MRPLDIAGQRFGKLIAIRYSHSTKHIAPTGLHRPVCTRYWECICDCGRTCLKATRGLRGSDAKSCGICSSIRFKGDKNPIFTGCGDIYGTYMLNKKQGAVRRGMCFEITAKQVWELYLKQNRKCVYTGMELSFKKEQGKGVTASIDRIDSSIGYTPDNIQIVHKFVNVMKREFTHDEFIDWCRQIVNYNDGKRTTGL